MADGGGIDPPHPCGLGALATRCLTSRPTVRLWRKRQESNLQGLAARTVFGTGPLANGVCASMWELRSLVPLAGFEPATSAHLERGTSTDWATGAVLGLGWTGARSARSAATAQRK